MVQEAVEDGGDGGVFEDLAPGRDAAVGGQDDRAVFVAAGDDLEEVAGAPSLVSRAGGSRARNNFGSHARRGHRARGR